MSTQTFMLPDLGEGLTEAVIVKWLVAVGDTVAVDQPIAEVETAKSIVELPTPFGGTVLALHGAEGEAIDTGAPVIEVDDGSAATAVAAATASAGGHTGGGTDRVEAEAYRSEERAGTASGNVLIGYGTGSGPGKNRRRRRASAASEPRPDTASAAASGGAGAGAERSTVAIESGSLRTGPVPVRSPIVRRLARELGVDVRAVDPSGADGAVTRADVLAAAGSVADAARASAAPFADATAAKGSASTASAAATTAGLGELHGLGIVETTRFSPLRKAVAAKLSQSRAEIPEATVWVDVDFTELWRLRPQMAAEGERPPSVTTLVARYTLMALREYPMLAARLTGNSNEITVFDGVNLGLAVNSDRGLSVPVLPRADALSLSELDVALRDLSAEARSGRIPPQRLTGSTFTLNNYGGFGVDGSTPIINHPEVAMLGMGRVIERPWVVDGEIVARRIAQIALVFDHRVCDGGYASGFLRGVVDRIENPLLAYREL